MKTINELLEEIKQNNGIESTKYIQDLFRAWLESDLSESLKGLERVAVYELTLDLINLLELLFKNTINMQNNDK